MKAIVSLFLVMFAAVGSSAEVKWQWVKVSSAVGQTDTWIVEKGTADVVITNQTFLAKLYWGNPSTKLKVELKGTVKDGKLAVTEKVIDSDVSGSTYTGTYQTRRWNEFAGTIGADSINLSNGWSMIGIERAVSK